VLKETYGIALYQEQVMHIANILAGFSMADADGLRKAMGKKLPAVMAEYKGRFVSGAKDQGIEAKIAVDVWDMIERFAGYGFNKSHSAAYAVIAAQTAYMKAHYPVEFMAALMSTEMGNTDKTVFNVAECRRAGIPILPPDINRSGVEFGVEDTGDGVRAVRFGLGAVKNVGVGAVTSIVESRDNLDGRELSSLDAFCDAVDWSTTNKRVIESLTKAGALDSFGHRAAVVAGLEQAIGAAQKRQKAAARGQMDLFGLITDDSSLHDGPSALPDVPEADTKQILEWEKEFLGLYLSSHPLNSIVGNGVPNGFMQVVDFIDLPSDQKVKLIAMVTGVRRITTRQNKTMAVAELEDLTGTVEAVAFPSTYESFGDLLEPDTILVISGKLDERGDQKQIILESVSSSLPEFDIRPKSVPSVVIELPLTGDYWQDVQLMQRVDEVLRRNEGDSQVVLVVEREGALTRMRSRSRRIIWNEETASELEEVVGSGRTWLDQPVAATLGHDAHVAA
jgi:DNA polymerase III subunit alpha